MHMRSYWNTIVRRRFELIEKVRVLDMNIRFFVRGGVQLFTEEYQVMMRNLTVTLLSGLLFAMLVPYAFGQAATGAVNGIVADTSGAVLPGATVTLVNDATNVEQSAKTSASGGFVFVNVTPGNYSLRVQAEGFKAWTTSFAVGVSETITQSPTLALGAVSQTVEVESTAQLLESTTTELGSVIGEQSVHDLPLNGRNFSQLLILTPGVSPISTGQGASQGDQDGTTSAIPGSQFYQPSLQGQNNRTDLYYMDGIINSDLRTSQYAVLPSIDAIQEFKVISHNADTQYGGVLGGVINVSSKSGANQFHGSAYEFVRNNDFDARNPFTDANRAGPPPFHQNQFGATVGGPVLLPHYNGRNKAFFFFGYEGWRYSKPTQAEDRIPTAAELSGDFSANPFGDINPIFNPYSTFPDPNNPGDFLRSPFMCDGSGNPIAPNGDGTQTGGTPCQQIPSQLISSLMEKYLTGYADTPNLTGVPGENFIVNSPETDNDDTFDYRIDYHLGKSDSLFFRWTRMNVTDNTPTGAKQTSEAIYHGTDAGGGWDHVFSPHLILDLRAGYMQKPYEFGSVNSQGLTPALNSGLGGVQQFEGATVGLALPYTNDGASFGSGLLNGSIRNNPLWNTSANMNWISGKHNISFGYQYIHITRIEINTGESFNFTNDVTDNPEDTGTTGNSLASALLGFPDNFSGSLNSISGLHINLGVYGFYVQDQWRLAPKVTLDWGMRYDLAPQPLSVGARLSNGLDLFNKDWILGASAYPPACNPPQYINPCIPGGIQSVPFSDHIVLAYKRNFMDAPNYNNFGPRVGVAWQWRPDTAVRVGYGIYWDNLSARTQSAENDLEQEGWPYTGGFAGTANRLLSNGTPPGAPGNPLTQITGLAGSFSTPLPAPSPWTSSGWADQPNLQNPYSQQWNLDIQHEFGTNEMLSVAYVGSVDHDLPYSGYANAAPVASPNGTPPATVDAMRAMPWMDAGAIVYTQALGVSRYHALEASFQRQFTDGLSTLLSYTWSKSLDNSSGYYDVENNAGGPGVQNYFDPSSNYGPSGFNIPQMLSWVTLWEPPIGQGKRWLSSGPASWLLGDWQLNSVLQARTGQAYSLGVNANDVANIGGTTPFGGYARPNLIGDPHSAVPKGSVFNPAAFAIPSGSFGNLGRDTLNAPNVFNVDFSMFKNFPLGNSEVRNLQLRAEGFNVFNIQNWGVPGTTIGISNAGVVSQLASGTQPREIQFAARITF
jgi:hypothetical protein